MSIVALYRSQVLEVEGNSIKGVFLNIVPARDLEGINAEYLGVLEGSDVEYYIEKDAIGKVDLSSKTFI